MKESMPVETHGFRYEVYAADVTALLWMLLGDLDVDDSSASTTTLAELGIDAAGIADLWAAACEEFGERQREPEIDRGALESAMTVETAAAVIARQLWEPT